MLKINLFDIWINKLSDRELISKIHWWNHWLYSEIYEKYKGKIYNYTLNLLWWNIEDAEIVITDIFTKFREYIKDGRCNDVENVNAYIYRLAHNTAVNFIKWKWSWTYQNIEDREWSLTTSDDPSDYTDNIYKSEQLERFMNMLDPNSKSVVYMTYFEEKDYEEIAQIIWSNKNTVWTILSRAKKKLREMMEGQNIILSLL